MQIYPTVLALHSCWRWMVLLAAVVALGIAIRGLAGKHPFAPWGRKAGVIYVTALDMQLLLGLLLYGVSPIVRTAWANMAVAMKVHELRFFSVEHLVSMLIAVALAHIGSIRSKRATSGAAQYRQMLIWYAASLAAILVGIPWWRPLFRGLLSS